VWSRPSTGISFIIHLFWITLYGLSQEASRQPLKVSGVWGGGEEVAKAKTGKGGCESFLTFHHNLDYFIREGTYSRSWDHFNNPNFIQCSTMAGDSSPPQIRWRRQLREPRTSAYIDFSPKNAYVKLQTEALQQANGLKAHAPGGLSSIHPYLSSTVPGYRLEVRASSNKRRIGQWRDMTRSRAHTKDTRSLNVRL